VRFDNIAAGWEQYILLISDNHHDSPYCNRKLEKAHLDLAKERGALILFGGDVFDAMNGKYDPRRSLDDVRPEDKGANYLDRIVEHAADDFSAYVENILAIGMGNHEATVLNNSGTNITSNLVHHLNSKHGGSILTMGIKCWIQFYFKIQKTVGLSKTIRYHHGADGSAPVTKGAIHTNRQAVYLPDADVVWNGHNHNEYYIPLARERISQQGVELTDIIHFVRTPGYKDEINMRDAKKFDVTYSDIKNFSPTPKGCAFLRFYYNGKSSIEIDVMCIAK
jgi:hypothetical protein